MYKYTKPETIVVISNIKSNNEVTKISSFTSRTPTINLLNGWKKSIRPEILTTKLYAINSLSTKPPHVFFYDYMKNKRDNLEEGTNFTTQEVRELELNRSNTITSSKMWTDR